jgi:hypothetical protein
MGDGEGVAGIQVWDTENGPYEGEKENDGEAGGRHCVAFVDGIASKVFSSAEEICIKEFHLTVLLKN